MPSAGADERAKHLFRNQQDFARFLTRHAVLPKSCRVPEAETADYPQAASARNRELRRLGIAVSSAFWHRQPPEDDADQVAYVSALARAAITPRQGRAV
jgi:hypothetical protein